MNATIIPLTIFNYRYPYYTTDLERSVKEEFENSIHNRLPMGRFPNKPSAARFSSRCLTAIQEVP